LTTEHHQTEVDISNDWTDDIQEFCLRYCTTNSTPSVKYQGTEGDLAEQISNQLVAAGYTRVMLD
jgi:hypothetical protein